jgi:ferredoxin
MRDHFARSRDLGLVLNSDNVQKNISFVCHCCKCCCNPLLGIRVRGYPHCVVTSSYIAAIDTDACIGCGVCALKRKPGACRLDKRPQRVIHPETTFERILLQCMERGTLQNQLFDNPASLTHKFLRGLVGGFLKLPAVKRALMSDALRSRFLDAMKKGAARQGKGWLTEM